MKDELNHSYNGGGVVYVLKSELSRSSLHYQITKKIRKIYLDVKNETVQ